MRPALVAPLEDRHLRRCLRRREGRQQSLPYVRSSDSACGKGATCGRHGRRGTFNAPRRARGWSRRTRVRRRRVTQAAAARNGPIAVTARLRPPVRAVGQTRVRECTRVDLRFHDARPRHVRHAVTKRYNCRSMRSRSERSRTAPARSWTRVATQRWGDHSRMRTMVRRDRSFRCAHAESSR